MAGFRSDTLRFNTPQRFICCCILTVGLSCRASGSGTLKGFGSDYKSALGDGHSDTAPAFFGGPVIVTKPIKTRTNVVESAAGQEFSLYITSDGSLWAVGSNSAGQLGDGSLLDRWDPVLMATGVAHCATGDAYSLYLTTAGDLWGCGDNSAGQLGLANVTFSSRPTRLAQQVVFVAAGRSTTFFIKADGSLWGMGQNVQGQLGDGTKTDRSAPVHIADGVTKIATGRFHSLFIKSDRTAWFVGSNAGYQLGDGTQTDHLTPVQMATDVAQVAVAGSTSLLLKSDGTLWGAGSSNVGQLGGRNSVQTLTQIASSVSALSASTYNTLFVKTDNTLWGMGWNNFGQLGDGTSFERDSPTQVDTSVSSVSTSEGHTLYIKKDGTVWGAGANSFGQLLDGTTDVHWLPLTISDNVVAMAAGSGSTFYVKSDGTLWATGSNWAGQLGDGTEKQRAKPVQIASGVSKVESSRAGSHSAFIKTDGTLWMMGENEYGQLGIGTADSNFHPTPVQIATGVAAVALGRYHSLFVKTDGSLWAMGSNDYGQLGDGTKLDKKSPVQIATGVKAVSAYEEQSFFIKSDGTLWGMGSNGYQELGRLGSNISSPVLVSTGVSSVASGFSHTAFLKTDGTLWCMGDNINGEYDNGTFSTTRDPWQVTQCYPSFAPYKVTSDVLSVAAGYNTTYYIKRDHTLWGMGINWDGELGDATLLGGGRYSPVLIANGVSAISVGDYHVLMLDGASAGISPAVSEFLFQSVSGVYPTISFEVMDADTDPSNLTLTVATSDGQLLPTTNAELGGSGSKRTITFHPNEALKGTAVLTITASDGIRTSSTARVITVNENVPTGHFSFQPENAAVAVGGTAVFSAPTAGSLGTPRYRWQRFNAAAQVWEDVHDDSVYFGTGSDTLSVHAADSTLNGAQFRCVMTDFEGSDLMSLPALLNVFSASTVRIINISTRSFVGSGGDVMIAGFIISGNSPKSVLIRGSGPGLQQFGITSFLQDPVMELHDANNLLATNDNWGDDPAQKSAFNQIFSQQSLFPWSDNSTDSAIMTTLNPGGYTAIIKGKNSATGVALLEVYEVNSPPGDSKFFNISTRSLVKTGADVQIAGFIVSGTGPKKLVIRASGPALTQYNVPGVLADPLLEVHDSSTTIATNDDWDTGLQPEFRKLGIDNWTVGSRDSALVLTLQPGAYTAIVSGKNGGTGVSLIEVFEDNP